MGMWSGETKGLVGFLPGIEDFHLIDTFRQTSEQHSTFLIEWNVKSVFVHLGTTQQAVNTILQ